MGAISGFHRDELGKGTRVAANLRWWNGWKNKVSVNFVLFKFIEDLESAGQSAGSTLHVSPSLTLRMTLREWV